MADTDQTNKIHFEVETKNCTLSGQDRGRIEGGLNPLQKLVADFPVVKLLATIERHARSRDYHVRTALTLSGKTLFTGDHDEVFYSAYERCIRKLVRKTEAYKAELDHRDLKAKRAKGTTREVLPVTEPDLARLQEAVDAGDYAAFRQPLYVYEEPLRKRVGRWVKRYPEMNQRIGENLSLDDIVEEVFLNAFERFHQRPEEVRLGDWLEERIDDATKMMMRNLDEELRNVSFARSWTEAESE